MIPEGVPVFAWKGETLDEYWWCTEQALRWDGGTAGPNMILDDGGDATMLVHKGAEFEADGAVPEASEDESEEWQVFCDLLRRSLPEDGNRWTGHRRRHPGCHRGDHDRRSPPLPDVRGGPDSCSRRSTSTTPPPSRKFDNLYGCRHSLVDGINRATDVMLGGKTAVVCGYGDVGKGCAQSLRGQGARVIVTEIDPDLCAAGGDGGLPGGPARGRDRDR